MRHGGFEATGEQEAHLPRALARVGRRRAETAAPDLARARRFGVARALQGRVDQIGGQGASLQGLAQAPRTEAGRFGMHQRVGGPRVAQQALLLEFVEHPLNLRAQRLDAQVGIVGVSAGRAIGRCASMSVGPSLAGQQFGRQLGPAMFTLRQQAQRACLDRRRVYASAPVSAPSTGIPTDSRTLFSISRARSGFSRRNSRALSLPWPIFSPL